MGAGAVPRRAAGGRRSARRPWLAVALFLLVAVFGPQLPQPDTSRPARVAAPVTFSSHAGDDAAVAVLVRPTGAAMARGDQRPHIGTTVAVVARAVPVPALVAVGRAADSSYDVLAGAPVEPISRGPPVEA